MDKIYSLIKFIFNIICYVSWVVLQIFITSHKMIMSIIRRDEFLPSMVLFDVTKYSLSDMQKMILTCSISITPGTMSVLWKNKNTLLVHQMYEDDFNKASQELIINKIKKICLK
jgi:multisubunit Na+/H+ antiporter MnhE subunit